MPGPSRRSGVASVEIDSRRITAKAGKLGVNQVRAMLRFAHRHAFRATLAGEYSKGALAASLYIRGPYLITTGRASVHVEGSVGSVLPYAASVERGAEVHNIFPKGSGHFYRFGSRRRPMLRFVWRGRIVFTPHVPMSVTTIGRSHPGQRGKRYLRNAAIETALRYNAVFIPGIGTFE